MSIVKSVYYERTKQVKQYEPLKVGVTVERDASDDTAESMLEVARDYVNGELLLATSGVV